MGIEGDAVDGARAPAPWWRRAGRSFLELFCLTGFAVAQPVLGVFGQAPDIFLFRDASSADIVVFAVVVTIVPALVLWSVEQVVGAVSWRAGEVVHVAFLAVVAGLIAVQVVGELGIESLALALLLATSAAASAAFLYLQVQGTRTWLAFASPAPVVFLALFLAASPVSDLVGDQDVVAAEVAEARRPVSIVMIVWDEWPASSIVAEDGSIDSELYPNLASLAADGAWFRNATTVATATTYAVPSMLTGRYPEEGTTTAAANQYPENLFTLLADQYDIEATESVTKLCPDNLCSGEPIDDPVAAEVAVETVGDEKASALGGLFSDVRTVYRSLLSPGDDESDVLVFEEEVVVASPQPDTDAAVDEARRTGVEAGMFGMVGPPVLQLDTVEALLTSIEEDEQPTLHFLHVQLPHAPYRFFADGSFYAEGAGGGGPPGGMGMQEAMAAVLAVRSPEEQAVANLRQRLIQQAGYTDTVIGQVVDRLEETGLYDESIVLMTSDHGAGFVPGETPRGFGGGGAMPEAVYADILYTPLVVKGPGLEGGMVSDANVEAVDILPTLADQIGVELPWTIDGRSLLGPPRESDEKIFHQVGATGGAGLGEQSAGPRVTFDGAIFFERMLDRHVGTVLFDDNPDYRGFTVDEAGEIVGGAVGDLTVVESSGLTATIDEIERFADVERDSGFVPALVVGEVSGGPNGETDAVTVAVVVNGRVAAVVPTYPEAGAPRHLDALIVPSLIDEGDNEVTLYRVTGDEDDRQLAPIDLR